MPPRPRSSFSTKRLLAALAVVCGLGAATVQAPAQEGKPEEGAEVFKKCRA